MDRGSRLNGPREVKANGTQLLPVLTKPAPRLSDIEVPRAGEYRVWVRYADWSNKNENLCNSPFTEMIERSFIMSWTPGPD